MKKIWSFWKRKTAIPSPGEFQPLRGRVFIGLILGIYGIVFVRAVCLQVLPLSHPSLAYIADHQYQKDLAISPDRGAIYDRKGEPFAISVTKQSVAINPAVFEDTRKAARTVSKVLNISATKIAQLSKKDSYFAWLKRKVSKSQASRVEALGLKGIHLISEPARFYPVGSVGAHLVGLVGIDNQGLMGLEKELDQDLQGKKSQFEIHRDGKQRIIFLQPGGVNPEKSGNSVFLTIDRPIQEIAERALQEGVEAAEAKKGFAIVADPHTGKLLAIANYPSFNPNHFQKGDLAATYNQALNNLFEPGSVTKPLIVAGALDRGTVTPQKTFDCEDGMLRIGRNRIRDTKEHEVLSVEETLVFSSNICTYKIAQTMGQQATYDTLRGFGVGAKETKLGFAGEQIGAVRKPGKWRDIRFANISFGQGFLTTGMELVAAISAIANGGNLVKPMLIERLETSDGKVLSSHSSEVIRRVIKPSTAEHVRQMMRQVVEHEKGSGSRAKNDFYSVAGKTGTAQKIDPGKKGYSATRRTASFIGFSPVDDPHIIVYVVIDEPGVWPYYGGRWAAPVVKDIVVNTLRYLNVPQDKSALAEQEESSRGARTKIRL